MTVTRMLLITHLIAAGAGYYLAPKELLETEVVSRSFFTTDTKRVLSAAVESLRTETSMVVYRVRSSATVSTERNGPLFLNGRQDLLVPAAYAFHVNLAALSQDDVAYDPTEKLVTVQLPPLTIGDIAFEPEGARTLNGGLLTFSGSEVDELTRSNYKAARRALIKQAQSPALVEAAKGAAVGAVQRAFEVPLNASGRSDVKVRARFDEG